MNNITTHAPLSVAHLSVDSGQVAKPLAKKQKSTRIRIQVLCLQSILRPLFVTILLVGSLCATLLFYWQTNDALHKEAYKALAIVLLICQARNLSQNIKQG